MVALVLIVFTDLVGFGLIIPQLPFYGRRFGASDSVAALLFAACSAAQLVAGLAWVSPEAQTALEGSFPAAQPDRLIDFILADPQLPMTRFEVVDSTLSDHRPLVADPELPRRGH